MGKCFKNRQALIQFCQYYFNEDENGNVECLLFTDEAGELGREVLSMSIKVKGR